MFLSSKASILKSSAFENPLNLSLLVSSFLNHTYSGLWLVLAPLLGQKIFPSESPATQLVYIYSLLCSSLLTYPLGVILCNRLLCRFDATFIFFICSILSACAFLLMGMCKFASTLMLSFIILSRMTHGIGLSLESSLMRLYLLDHKSPKESYGITSYVEMTVMIGMIIPCFIGDMTWMNHHWHYCFQALAFFQFFIIIIRMNNLKTLSPTINHQKENTLTHTLKTIWRHRKKFLLMTLVNGISQLTYFIPFVVMNHFLITQGLNNSKLLWSNGVLLCIDMLCIPLMAKTLKSFSPIKILRTIALLLAVIFAVTSFLSNEMPLSFIIFIKTIMIMAGIAFLVPQGYFFKTMTDPLDSLKDSVILTGLSKTLAQGIFGRLLIVLFAYIIGKTYMFFWIGLISSFICIIFYMIAKLFSTNILISSKFT